MEGGPTRIPIRVPMAKQKSLLNKIGNKYSTRKIDIFNLSFSTGLKILNSLTIMALCEIFKSLSKELHCAKTRTIRKWGH